MGMRTCAIVAAAAFNAKHFQALYDGGAFECVIAADGGYAHLQEAGCMPHQVLGDFDSLGFVPDHPCVERHNPHKDASDLELALDSALSQGFDTVYVYGCLSGRLDHTVAALQQLARASEAGMTVTGVGDGFAVRALTGPSRFDIPVPAGVSSQDYLGTVSVFAAGDRACGVTERGMAYPLEDAELTNRTSLGLSNELTGNAASVSIEAGTVYVFYPI